MLTQIPSGTVVESDRGWFYIKAGKRYRITSRRILDSWRFQRIVEVDDSVLSKYPLAGKLGFRDGSLIWNLKDGRIYLIADNKRHHVTGPDILAALGAEGKDVIAVSEEEVNLQKEGEEIWQ